jgi:hypothetical protein
MRRRTSQHTEWLSLVESSGPFLAVSVLEDVFPQGMAAIETPARRHVRSAYEEWRDAVDEDDPLLGQLHQEWARLVLADLLEFEDSVLADFREDESPFSVSSPDGLASFAPDFALTSASEDKPKLFISVQPPGADLEKVRTGDGWPASIVDRMTLLCRTHEVRLGLLTNGERWMVVNAPVGSTSGHTSWYARLWFQEPVTLQAFQSLLGVRRWFGPEEETLPAMLEASLAHHEEVTDTLGEQVKRAVEVLIQCLDRADQDRNRELLHDVEPAELYEAGLTVMMRLVFVLCAEERGLLLLDDPVYDQNYAISTLRAQLEEDADQYGPEVLERRHDAWARLLAVFRAVYGGVEHETLRMPALGGSLFDPDRFPFLEGRGKDTKWTETPARPLPIDNRTVLLLLTALQVLEQRGGALLLSYKALDVEQIGHVYEGLLEHTVRRLPQVTLGLLGSQKAKNPNLPLAQLESAALDGQETVVDLVKEATQRSVSAILNALEKDVDDQTFGCVLLACGGDVALAERIRPYANLLRTDAWGEFIVYPENAFAVTLGADRRETGTHYTPKSLTESIVQTTLEPVVYTGPAEGLPREDWKLKSSAELLDLKVCDPAMGSGAFLVQVCRYLSERVVEAWGHEEGAGKFVTIDGEVLDEPGEADPLPESVDDRLTIARRIVAERCLYGVDLNPLAVELAKLSIWLVTLAKGRPFGFLDHNLISGDSLVGIHQLDQLTRFSYHPKETTNRSLFAQNVEPAVHEAIETRALIRETRVRDIRDVQDMAELAQEARDKVRRVKLLADALVGEVLESGGSDRSLNSALSLLLTEAGSALDGELSSQRAICDRSRATLLLDNDAAAPRQPLHWPLEFPEVFSRDGFDAIVGNPPFMGNSHWKTCLGDRFQGFVKALLRAKPGKIDISVVFHRRAADLLRGGGCYGLLAANNICEGTSLRVGLGELVNAGDIFWCQRDMKWPGKASVVTAVVSFLKGKHSGTKYANGVPCERIGPRLQPESQESWQPQRLGNCFYAFKGVDNSRGLAFVINNDDEWFGCLRHEPSSLLRPYVTGNDITSTALRSVDRWALDIGDRSLEWVAANYPVAHDFLLKRVQPTRTPQALSSYRGLSERWWQFWNHRSRQLRRIRRHPTCIVFSRVTKHPMCILADPTWIYIEGVVLVSPERPDTHAICLSSFFTEWIVARQGAKFGVGASLRLSIRGGIETFPLPDDYVCLHGMEAANRFDHVLKEWCEVNDCGVTSFADALGSSDQSDLIQEARDLLCAIDSSVASAYGWNGVVPTRSCDQAHYVTSSEANAFVVDSDGRKTIIRFLRELNKEQYRRRGPA